MTTRTPLTREDVRQAFMQGDFDAEDARQIAGYARRAEQRLLAANLRGMDVGSVLTVTDRGVTFKVEITKVNRTKVHAVSVEATERFPEGTPLEIPMAMLEMV